MSVYRLALHLRLHCLITQSNNAAEACQFYADLTWLYTAQQTGWQI